MYTRLVSTITAAASSENMATCPFSSRRAFLGTAGVVGGAAVASTLVGPAAARELDRAANASAVSSTGDERIAFRGIRQAGIDTPQQTHTVFASFDVTTERRADLVALLQRWTSAAERLTTGDTALPLGGVATVPPSDSGETLGLTPRRLTLTFGFGPALFERSGVDRFGLRARKPTALADLPAFHGDQLEAARSGGDLCIQACADDRQIAFHAIRQLARLATPLDASVGYGSDSGPNPAAILRWTQAGCLPDSTSETSPRNLLGFPDGTQNPGAAGTAERAGGKDLSEGTLADTVWVGAEGPTWMRGGSYLVVRRVRLALEHWDRSALAFQERVIGRKKSSGAPQSGGDAGAKLDLDAVDKDGTPLIAENAHVRLGAASANAGARMLRRSYSYDDGLSMVAERWPPWHQGLEYDAGLLFIAHQRDPRTAFVPMFARMSKFDLLNQYATHVGSALFACPHGVALGRFIGEDLFG